MIGAKEFLQVKFLKTLEPLSSLSIDKLEELANKSTVEELPAGRVIFRQGEKDSRAIYLLTGQLELQVTGNPKTESLKAKTAETRYPIAQEWPRPSTCRTKTNSVLLYIDSNLLEILLSDNPSGQHYEVTEIGVEEDPESEWMLRFLQSPAFLQLPTDNIQKLLITLEEVKFKAGDTIVRQGDSDQWYYIVKQGKCTVARRPAPKAEEVRLALLGPGDGFGEEALITNGKRNATITAKEATTLMRLSKADFHQLLVEPMLSYIDHGSMMEKVKGGAALIDVRTNKEFNDNGIKGALNIPLSMLRLKAKDLNTTREHIVYCNDASLSSAAAFLLAQQSLQVHVLRDGLNGQQKTFSPAAKQAASPAPAAAAPPKLSETTAEPPVLEPVTRKPVAEEVFHQHKRNAQTQAQRATEAESAHKQAEARTAQLRQEADALRAQANQLASKTATAEAQRQKAENEVRRIKEETLKQRDEILANAKVEVAREKERARQTEQEVNRLKQQAEETRRNAEEELARIKREADSVNQMQSRLDEEFKRAESEKQQAARAAEVARIMAKQEAEKVRAEAEAIRQQAIAEAEQLKQEMESRKAKMEAEDAAKHQAAVEAARQKAEKAINEAASAAEEARRQATMEAETIRKQAIQEAERMRVQLEREKQEAAEAAARAKAEEQLRIAELEDVRRKAEAEAENIRQQALEEARQRAKEESRRLVELEAASLRQKTFEEVQRQAMQTARLQAEQAAEAIRREALEEASRLRQEMENTRQLVESEALRAKAKIEEDAARRQAEEDELARAAAESARRAAEEAERRRTADARRRLDEEEQRRAEALRLQQEQEAQQRAAEARRLALEEEKRREAEARARAIADERRKQEAQRQAKEARKASEAEKLAASLKQRMEQNNARKQADEFVYDTGSGPKLSKAKMHIIKDKTILEGEEDIFVFKAPSEKPPTREEAEMLLKEAEAQFKEKKDLPSFDLEYADENEPHQKAVKEEDSQFSDEIVVELDNLTAKTTTANSDDLSETNFSIPSDVREQHKPRSRRSLIVLAASVLVMIAISVVVITRPTYLNKDVVAAWAGDGDQASAGNHGLAAIRQRSTEDARTMAEDRVKAQANAEFQQLLMKWRKDKASGTH